MAVIVQKSTNGARHYFWSDVECCFLPEYPDATKYLSHGQARDRARSIARAEELPALSVVENYGHDDEQWTEVRP